MPLVGCEAIRTVGSDSSSLPTKSFCWLPPDNAWAATSILGVRTSNSLQILEVFALEPFLLKNQLYNPEANGSCV